MIKKLLIKFIDILITCLVVSHEYFTYFEDRFINFIWLFAAYWSVILFVMAVKCLDFITIVLSFFTVMGSIVMIIININLSKAEAKMDDLEKLVDDDD